MLRYCEEHLDIGGELINCFSWDCVSLTLLSDNHVVEHVLKPKAKEGPEPSRTFLVNSQLLSRPKAGRKALGKKVEAPKVTAGKASTTRLDITQRHKSEYCDTSPWGNPCPPADHDQGI